MHFHPIPFNHLLSNLHNSSFIHCTFFQELHIAICGWKQRVEICNTQLYCIVCIIKSGNGNLTSNLIILELATAPVILLVLLVVKTSTTFVLTAKTNLSLQDNLAPPGGGCRNTKALKENAFSVSELIYYWFIVSSICWSSYTISTQLSAIRFRERH